jgi:hypothetical protein
VRSALVVLLAGAIVAGWAGPAAAHAGGLVATDARARVVALTPAAPGLTVEAVENGAKLRLTNSTGTPVAVRAGGGPATPAVVPAGGRLTWADTRSSPVGKRAGDAWSLVLDAGDTAVTVTGDFTGAPPPAAAVWWALVVLLAAGLPLVVRRLRRRPDLVLATCGLAAGGASLAHVTGSSLAVVSAPFAGTFLNAAGINLLAWPLIAGGAVAAGRGRAAGLLAVCAGAALTAVFVLPDVTSFHRAVLPFAGPPTLERALVVLALGGGAGVAVAGAPVLRRMAEADR